MDKDEREALARRILEFGAGRELEVMVSDDDGGLTRFARGAVHQNLAQRETSVRLRTIEDGRTGVASGNDLAEDALRQLVARAAEIAALAPRDETLPGLTANRPAPAPREAYVEATAAATPAWRARIAGDVLEVAERGDLWAAGYVSTARSGLTLANTSGTLLSFDGTECRLNVKQSAADSSGFAEANARDVKLIDGRRVAETAAEKAVGSAAPKAVEPGAWTVILEPAAFGELLSYLSEHFSAQAFDEGSSFLSDGLDRTYAGDNVWIGDDFAHPLHAGMPFDFEGYPVRRLPLIEGGVAKNVVTDATWARRLRRPNTGHGLPAPSAAGPQALHIVVGGGTKTVEQLVAETRRGLLVSRFWYIRPVDERKTIVTGMTRDGTFLIENGTVGPGVRNMRFNQSILEALGRVEFADRQVLTGGYAYSIVVPAVKIDGFHFTSSTDF